MLTIPRGWRSTRGDGGFVGTSPCPRLGGGSSGPRPTWGCSQLLCGEMHPVPSCGNSKTHIQAQHPYASPQ